MKIAYFTDTYLPQINGVTFVVENHSKLLSKNSKVKIYAPAYKLKRITEVNKVDGIEIERYPSIPVINYKELHLSFMSFPQIFMSIKKYRPDIIHFHSPGPIGIASIMIARYLKIPLICTYHTLFSETIPPLPPFNTIYKIFKIKPDGKDLLRNIIWDSSKKIFDYCDVIVAPTKMIKDELAKHDHKSKIVVISNGIDTDKFNYKLDKKCDYKLIYVGRVSYEKKVDVIIKAFKKVLIYKPNATLEIVGNGPAMASLIELAKELKIYKKIIFKGYVSREKLPEYYHQNNIFVTASEMEVQPLTILEAMSCGLPIVGVGRGGVAALVKNSQNGYLVEPEDYTEMSKKIIDILSDNKLRIKFSKKSRSLAEKESYNKSISKLEKVYKSLTSQFSI